MFFVRSGVAQHALEIFHAPASACKVLRQSKVTSKSSSVTAAEQLDRGYVGTVLRLTLLAPNIVEAALSGRSGDLGLARLLEPWPVEWGVQRVALLD